MKKILSIFSILILSLTTGLTTVACVPSKNNNQYHTLADIVKNMSLTGDVKINTKVQPPTINSTHNLNNIRTVSYADFPPASPFKFFLLAEFFTKFFKLKVASDFDFSEMDDFDVKSITKADNQELTDEDLTEIGKLNLKTVLKTKTQENTFASTNINILENIPEKEIVNQINNFNYNEITQAQLFIKLTQNLIYKGIELKDFLPILMAFIPMVLGFRMSFIEFGKLQFTTFKNNNHDLNQDDLNHVGILNLNITYKYINEEYSLNNIKIQINEKS